MIRVRIIARGTLVAYWTKHPDAKASLERWESIIEEVECSSTAEVQALFSKAKVLNGERVRFDLGGGDYRLIVSFKFKNQIAFVKFIGTHTEYDRVDALTVSQF